MNPISRVYPLLRVTHASMLRPISRTTVQAPSLRFYGQSAYGEGENKPAKSDISRAKEHPGPPPPNTQSRSDPQSEAESQQSYSATSPEAPRDPEKAETYSIPRIPSNKAHPTITSGKQSPNVDEEGHRRKDIREEVKEHNRGVEQRHDRSYYQLTDEGKVQKGF